MKRHPTIADIAKQLKISKASVAAALSGRGGNTRVGPDTIALVQQTAAQLNYRSNASARAISRRRFDTIGFCVAKRRSDDYGGFNNVSLSVVEAAEKRGQALLLVGLPSPTTANPVVPRTLIENCLDGLVIQSTTELSPQFRAAIEGSGVPVVYLNGKGPTNSIFVDDVESGRLMTSHLIDQGLRRIALLSPTPEASHYSAGDRVQGYRETMERAGLEPVVWTTPSPEWRTEMYDLLRGPARPEAIFCDGDPRALLLQRILYDLRLRVPEDIIITGCNDDYMAIHSTVPLTTLRIPIHRDAHAAVQLLMDLIQTGGPVPSVVFHPELVVRASSLRPDKR